MASHKRVKRLLWEPKENVPASKFFVVSIMGVIGWFSANRRTGFAIPATGTKAGLIKSRKIKIYEKAPAPA